MALVSCKECGKKISMEMKFCPNCGVHIIKIEFLVLI